MIIVISGTPASGKTTVASKLAERLGYREVYAGQAFRMMAEERGEDLDSFYRALVSDIDLEKSIDAAIAERMRREDNLVVQGRVAFLWPTPDKHRVSVFIVVDSWVGACRFMKARRSDEERFDTVAECRAYLEGRIVEERRRYQKIYGLSDHHDSRHFDLILDSTRQRPDDIVNAIVRYCRERGFLDD